MARSVAAALLLVALLAVPALGAKVNSNLTNKLVEIIQKKQFDAFTKELASDDMDVNQPDSKGRLPLVEAVRTKDVRFVDSLIQFGALANSKDLSGTSAIQVALQQGLVDVSRVLLAYGADVNIADKAGKKARDFASGSEVKALVKLYDAQGALAFEDKPGTWIKASNDKGEKYWYNVGSKEARWNTPPSCAWQRVEFQGHPDKYINYVTSQTVAKLPPALCWRVVRHGGSDVWYNWAANVSQVHSPDEMPDAMLAEARELKNTRWWNPKTQELSWEDPRYHTAWRELKEGDSTFYYNVVSGESQWEAPEELAWQEQVSEEHDGQKFWHNKVTGETTWEKPAAHSWEAHSDDL